MTPDTALFSSRKIKESLQKAWEREERLFLEKEVLSRLIERLEFIKKDFSSILLQGFQASFLAPLKDFYPKADLQTEPGNGPFDLILEGLVLHHLNDVPSHLSAYRERLSLGGLLMVSFFGGETLRELRECFLEAEIALTGGASLRVTPMISLQEASRFFQRLGFRFPVADRDVVELHYHSLFSLLKDIRATAQNDPFLTPPPPLTPSLLSLAEKLYTERYRSDQGKLKATLELITLTGWKT